MGVSLDQIGRIAVECFIGFGEGVDLSLGQRVKLELFLEAIVLPGFLIFGPLLCVVVLIALWIEVIECGLVLVD